MYLSPGIGSEQYDSTDLPDFDTTCIDLRTPANGPAGAGASSVWEMSHAGPYCWRLLRCFGLELGRIWSSLSRIYDGLKSTLTLQPSVRNLRLQLMIHPNAYSPILSSTSNTDHSLKNSPPAPRPQPPPWHDEARPDKGRPATPLLVALDTNHPTSKRLRKSAFFPTTGQPPRKTLARFCPQASGQKTP